MKNKIKKGDMTNKGLVKMIDNPWKKKDGADADLLVKTHNGFCRLSSLEKIPKAEKLREQYFNEKNKKNENI